MAQHYMAKRTIPYEVEVEERGTKFLQRRHWKAGKLVDRKLITEPKRFDRLLSKGSIVELKEGEIAATATLFAITGRASATDEEKFKGILKVGPSATQLEGDRAKGEKK